MNRERSTSLTSIDFYKEGNLTTQNAAAASELRNMAAIENEEQASHNINRNFGRRLTLNLRQMSQSRRLPYWLWYIIAKSLGIKLYENDKPVIATVLYVATFTSALSFVLTSAWYSANDIASHYTNTTLIDGSVGILFTALWSALGVYANSLAFRLFAHKKFSDMLRLHSKTILKINAAAMMFILMLSLIIVNDISGVQSFNRESCEKVNISMIYCDIKNISRVVYSVFSLLWNYIVAFAVMSACRTHTIGIRRFMKVLEADSKIFEKKLMAQFTEGRCDFMYEENAELNIHDPDEIEDSYTASVDEASLLPDSNLVINNEGWPQPSTSAGALSDIQSVTTSSSLYTASSNAQTNSRTVSFDFPRQNIGTTDEVDVQRQQESGAMSKMKNSDTMSNSEILFNFWKIQCRLRLTSTALQRWMISVVALVIIWLAMNLVTWLNNDPTVIDLANFFLPLLILPLLSSAYAEVNIEGSRLMKFIFPGEERLQMIYVLQQSPLQMTVFGFMLSYSTITTAAFGILLAFASKILLQELDI